MRTDALTLIRSAPLGSALWGRERLDSGASEVAWYLRETSDRIGALGSGPTIELRAAMIEQAGVLLVPILVRVGPDIWESWLNARQPGEAGLLALGDLAIQPRLAVHLVGDRGEIARTLGRSNPLQLLARTVLAQVQVAQAWAMAQFDDARDQVYARHPGMLDLWSALADGATDGPR